MTLYKYERYYIAHDALMVLTFAPSLIIFLCSLCMARRRRDPARRAFSWLKPAFGLFTLFVFLDFAGYGLSLAAARLRNDPGLVDDYSDLSKIIQHIQYASAETFTVSRLIESFTDLLTFLMLVSLGTGVIFAHEGKPNSVGKLLKFASLAASGILAILAIASFGLKTSFFNKVYSKPFVAVTRNMANQFNTSRQIDFAFRVLIFVLALGIVAQSVMVKVKTRGEPRLSKSSNYFIACGGLWLLRTVYGVAAMASTVNLNNYERDPEFENYFDILDVVFGTWPELVVLSLVFGLGAKKANGLWSTEQPFMTQGGSAVSPWGFNYDPNQASPPTMAQPPPAPMQQQSWPQYQQQQPYYPHEMPVQQQTMPQYAPQPQTHQPYMPQTQTRSPPPHEDAMGLNHQANGTPPQAAPQPYYEKA